MSDGTEGLELLGCTGVAALDAREDTLRSVRWEPDEMGGSMTEKEKLAAGQWYDPGDHAELSARRRFAQRKCFDFNHTDPEDHEE